MGSGAGAPASTSRGAEEDAREVHAAASATAASTTRADDAIVLPAATLRGRCGASRAGRGAGTSGLRCGRRAGIGGGIRVGLVRAAEKDERDCCRDEQLEDTHEEASL